MEDIYESHNDATNFDDPISGAKIDNIEEEAYL